MCVCTVYTVHCTVYSVHLINCILICCTLYTVKCIN